MGNSTTSFFSFKSIAVFVVIAAVFATLIALGSWQMKRLEWKENLLANLEQRLGSNPIGINELVDKITKGDEFEYQPVIVKGQFDHSKERHFFATHNGFSGYYVYTPLLSEEGTVFIQSRVCAI